MLISETLKVVLDTDVLIRALMAKKAIDSLNKKIKLNSADPAHCPLLILRRFENSRFALMTNHLIIEEYEKKLQEKTKENLINPSDFSHYLKLIKEKGIIDRILVKPIVIIDFDHNDNRYFRSLNCLNANFLITNNKRHFTETIQSDLNKISSPLLIVSPCEFLEKIS